MNKGTVRVFGIGLVVLFAAAVCTMSAAEQVIINFDQKMRDVQGSGLWTLAIDYGVLPEDFTFDPEVCDLNGGFNYWDSPVVMDPNGILDSDEFALFAAILADPAFDCRATGGTYHDQVYNAWINNYAEAYEDCGGGHPDCEELLSMVPSIDYLFGAIMTCGDFDTTIFPMVLMDLFVYDDTMASIIGDEYIQMPDLNEYVDLHPYLAWCGDADGDGCTNKHEYEHYYPTGGRSAYVNAALDPSITPPDCTGDDKICDGTGGLFGEYFNCIGLKNLRFTQTDQYINMHWGHASPHSSINDNDFSIRWTGWVSPEYSEVYTFNVRSDDGVRVWFDGALAIDHWSGGGEFSFQTTSALQAGQDYEFKIEYYENSGTASIWLGWESASQPQKSVHEMYLIPGTGEGEDPNGYCGGEWIYNPATKHYYKISDGDMNWLDAQAQAEAEGGYLVTINDADENTWVRETFEIYGTILIGANDIDEEGRWVWVENDENFWNGQASGTPVAGAYTNWNGGEPNDYGDGEDIVEMRTDGLWNDNDLGRYLRGVIEGSGLLSVAGAWPGFAFVEVGSQHTLTVDALLPTGQPTYQWKKDGTPIAGATDATLTLTDVSYDDEGYYLCTVTDEEPTTVHSDNAYVWVIAEGSLDLTGIVGLLVMAAACILGGAVALRRST